MFDSQVQTPIEDWLDLSPGLLSARNRRSLGIAEPVAIPLEDGAELATISALTVLSLGDGIGAAMTFQAPAMASSPPALDTSSHAYRSLDQGGTQHDALIHLASHAPGGFGW